MRTEAWFICPEKHKSKWNYCIHTHTRTLVWCQWSLNGPLFILVHETMHKPILLRLQKTIQVQCIFLEGPDENLVISNHDGLKKWPRRFESWIPSCAWGTLVSFGMLKLFLSDTCQTHAINRLNWDRYSNYRNKCNNGEQSPPNLWTCNNPRFRPRRCLTATLNGNFIHFSTITLLPMSTSLANQSSLQTPLSTSSMPLLTFPQYLSFPMKRLPCSRLSLWTTRDSKSPPVSCSSSLLKKRDIRLAQIRIRKTIKSNYNKFRKKTFGEEGIKTGNPMVTLLEGPQVTSRTVHHIQGVDRPLLGLLHVHPLIWSAGSAQRH